MKTKIQLFRTIILIVLSIYTFSAARAQAPAKMTYQAVIRNAANTLVANQGVGMRISILQGGATGQEIYKEIFNPNPVTNSNGLATLEIGTGLAITGTFAAIDWSAGPYFIKTETDPAGGTNYSITGTSELLSVPYALYAASGGSAKLSGTTGTLVKFSNPNEGSDSKVREDNTGVGVSVAPGSIGYRFRIDGPTGSFFDNGLRLTNSSVNTGWSFYISSNGDMFVGRTTNLGTFNGLSGAYSSTSDSRLKTNATGLESVLHNVMKIPVMRYEFKYNNPLHKKDLGVFAQDVQKYFPELISVNTTNEANPEVQDQLALNYSGLSVVALKAIQEQQLLIEAMKQDIAELLKRIELLEKKK